jgi:hypothetical protein
MAVMPKQYEGPFEDPEFHTDSIVAWAEANGLRPMHILARDVFIENGMIRFREIVPADGTEDKEYPEAVLEDPTDVDSVRVGEWQLVRMTARPEDFGLVVA